MAYVPWIIQKYWCSFDVKKHPSLLLSARQGPSVPTPPTSRRVLVPLPANTTFKTRSAARRPHVRGACPALIIGGVKCLQRRKNISAWRGHEDNGGEGQLGREPGYSGGDQFFPKENLCKLLFVTNFTFTFISESEIRPCTFWLCTVCNSMWPGPERWNM